MPDNIGQMFYYGETPWHKKGKKLNQPANADEAVEHGGLDWEVELFPIVTSEHYSRTAVLFNKPATVGDSIKSAWGVSPRSLQTKSPKPAKQATARTKFALVPNTTRCRPLHGLMLIYVAFLGLTPQALCCRLLTQAGMT